MKNKNNEIHQFSLDVSNFNFALCILANSTLNRNNEKQKNKAGIKAF